ncbi:MAG: UDP-N-acetylglucosamine 2-epimerase (non-hydrolyzing) [Bacteroidetes bacterium]|nr:UDP-N-acetylglucosamine 2-epimerase (non-hydrolyzing) [Bacteroidota bacterium]
MKVTLVAGARPNFMKIAPIIHEIKRIQKLGKKITFRLVHTGQHYDEKLSHSFFKQLNIPEPDVNLGVGSGSHAEQTANIMVKFEKELMANRPDIVLVVGDVNSTMACSISAKKLNIDVAHVEGGIRSRDMEMPEEINRLVTDSIADYFFTTSELANKNLRKEGHSDKKLFFVGNTMIDTLKANLSKLKKPVFFDEYKLKPKKYLVVTLHRPSNVDDADNLKMLLKTLEETSKDYKIVFPVHPRTQKNLKQIKLSDKFIITDPLSYLEFIYLVKNSFAVITDSGGIQEETTVMKIPCVTLRKNTERPETVTEGTNILAGIDTYKFKPYFQKLFSGKWKKGGIPKFWDGKTSPRIVKQLLTIYKNK